MPKITALRQTERRDRILDAAERCFARNGFQGATMAEICADAGVSAGGAYLYFRSKEDLIAGITERDRDRIAVDFARLADAPDFFEALNGLAQHYLVDEPPHRRALMLEIAAAACRNPAVEEQWRRTDKLIQDVFRKALAAQVKAGRIRPRHDVETLAALLMMIGDGMCQRVTLDPGFDHQSAAAVMMSLVRQLLGVEDAGAHATDKSPARAGKPLSSDANREPAALEAVAPR